MKWQPIETAPKDGTTVLLYRPTALRWCVVDKGRWETQKYHSKPSPYWSSDQKLPTVAEQRSWEPTHWMPLPEPPESE